MGIITPAVFATLYNLFILHVSAGACISLASHSIIMCFKNSGAWSRSLEHTHKLGCKNCV